MTIIVNTYNNKCDVQGVFVAIEDGHPLASIKKQISQYFSRIDFLSISPEGKSVLATGQIAGTKDLSGIIAWPDWQNPQERSVLAGAAQATFVGCNHIWVHNDQDDDFLFSLESRERIIVSKTVAMVVVTSSDSWIAIDNAGAAWCGRLANGVRLEASRRVMSIGNATLISAATSQHAVLQDVDCIVVIDVGQAAKCDSRSGHIIWPSMGTCGLTTKSPTGEIEILQVSEKGVLKEHQDDSIGDGNAFAPVDPRWEQPEVVRACWRWSPWQPIYGMFEDLNQWMLSGHDRPPAYSYLAQLK